MENLTMVGAKPCVEMENERMYQEVRVESNRITVVLAGDVFAAEAKALQQSLSGYITSGHTRIALDLSNVTFIDGTGLGVLVSIHKQVRNVGGYLQIVGLQGEVKELFRLTELDKLLQIESNQDPVEKL